RESKRRVVVAPKSDEAGLAVLRLEPGGIEPVVDCGRAEVPQNRIAATREQDPARKLVACPFTDLGRGDVADVVVVKQQECAEVGGIECGLRATEAITVHAAVIDPLFKIAASVAEHR